MFVYDNMRFVFQYNTEDDGIRSTFCSIIDDATNELIAMGGSFCSPKDNFKRTTGRKVAMARALEAVVKDRDVREKIWQKYFERIGKIA